MQNLRGKTAVVTGAASGIGRALVDRFLAEGMNVVLADVEIGPLEQATAELLEAGHGVHSVVTDVSRADDVERLAQEAVEAFGAAHVLCSNAGVTNVGKAWELSLDDWRWVIDVNLWGVIHGIRSFVPRFVAQGEGHVVNTSSMAGVALYPGLAPYTASKFGVTGLSESLRAELKLTKTPVGVSVLCPGFVQTRITDSARNRPGRGAQDPARTPRPAVSESVAAGMPPSVVADQVLDAIVNDRFWILTHGDEAKAQIATRMDEILASPQLSIPWEPGC